MILQNLFVNLVKKKAANMQDQNAYQITHQTSYSVTNYSIILSLK
jgi:hypothetical protein